MTPKERVIATLRHIEPDRVPTGENGADGKLVEQMLGRPILFNMGMKKLEALWDGRREDVPAWLDVKPSHWTTCHLRNR